MCPDALIVIVTNPLDSLVPVAAEVLKKRGVYRPERLFGVCQIDQMRAQRFYAETIGQEPKRTYVPVVGGHAEATTVPLFSKARPNVPLTEDETKELIQRVRTAGKKVLIVSAISVYINCINNKYLVVIYTLDIVIVVDIP